MNYLFAVSSERYWGNISGVLINSAIRANSAYGAQGIGAGPIQDVVDYGPNKPGIMKKPQNVNAEASNREATDVSNSTMSSVVDKSHATVNIGKQNKHIPGTNEYKTAINNGQTKSIMYGDSRSVQKLLDDYAGTGDPILGTNKERVHFSEPIGLYVDPNTGTRMETTYGIIHYGKNGAHIVPARPY